MIGTLIAAVTLLQAPAAATGVEALAVDAPVVLMELDIGRLKGIPIRLAWSEDGRVLYLQTAEQAKGGSVKERHYLLEPGAKAPKSVDEEPPWAAAYWQWKSGRAAPGSPAFKIEAENAQRVVTATSAPMGGNLARGGADTGAPGVSVDEVGAVAQQAQAASVWTLRLKGEVLGEWVNEPVVPGLTFGWAPEGHNLIAFASRDGRLVLMDEQANKRPVENTRDVVLPAWSPGADRLAWLERQGRKKAVVKVASVTGW